MRLKRLWGVAVRVAISLFCADVFYLAWLAAFIQAVEPDGPIVEAVLWVLAPVMTAAGFATGSLVFERLVSAGRSKFLHVFVWPLVGCAIGAGVVYWFGPMLIVFSMFAAGTASIILREVILNVNK